jgi:hypothetical protein
MNNGALDGRQYDGILAFSLMQSLDLVAEAEVSQGGKLSDWKHSQVKPIQWLVGEKPRVSLALVKK